MNLEALKDMTSRYLGRGIYQLVEFRHSKFTNGGLDFNFINGALKKPILIDGTEYKSLPFSYVLSPQGETSSSSIAIANVSRQIAQEIEKAVDNENIKVSLYFARIEIVDGIKYAQREFKGEYDVISCEIGEDYIALGINIRTSLGVNAGSLRFNKNDFPNLFL